MKIGGVTKSLHPLMPVGGVPSLAPRRMLREETQETKSQLKRVRSKIRTRLYQYLRCGVKTITFLFWAALYMVVVKITLFKSDSNTPVVKDWSMVPDNYTKWLLQGPVLGDDTPDLPINFVSDFEPDNETTAELQARATRVLDTCRKWHIPRQSINSKEFFLDHTHKLVWCNIFKAASSSWLYNFNVLGGYDKMFLSRTRQAPLMLARKKFPRPTEEELKNAVKMPGVTSLLVVREPFVRLLSAYRDKLEKVTPYYRKMAKTIVAENREEATKVFGPITSFGPTFYEFVAYLIKKHKRNENFNYDEHWAPYYQFCSPCAVNFSLIAKVETLPRDSTYVIKQLRLDHLLDGKISNRRMRIRTVMNKSRDGRNTTALLKHYFSQLNDQMLNDLLQIYGIDFEMFGYDSKVYRRYLRN
ncbi:carbohydrate sulfotransferase 11-like isoform X2 [Plodia interpunctella]|uniref:carbohydrate sulfotransferase 11-like isoform X2 n=1 Tax=Plodia interpunctella TaxID=58824 RepID=UPI002368C063|nr:carbohydrate sulfotransferase 11-like isoform X2 [Plodia interpunctella]